MAAARLYALPASHPSTAAELMLERKGLDYRRVDLVPAVHRPLLRALRFPGITVPALVIDGRRVQGSREISRALDEISPQPPLFPAEASARAAIESAERWGDEVLQPIPRRIAWWALRHDRSGVESFLSDAKLPFPNPLAIATAAPVVALSARLNAATDQSVEADLAALPGMLDQVDRYIEDGTIGGADPTAADYQIAPSVRLLMSFEDLRPAIEGRPAGAHAVRIVPTAPGRVGPVFPARLLKPLRTNAA
ncbi:MAG: glutathione S-transferase [Actinobacteria bacterium]|nr:glutathione S-transferase [Actinomycetota bacterium]